MFRRGLRFRKVWEIVPLDIYRLTHRIVLCDIFAKFIKLSSDSLVILLNRFVCYFFLFQTERREQHFTPGKFTPIKIPEGSPREGGATSLLEFPRHRLRLVEKLGEGGFGMVSCMSETHTVVVIVVVVVVVVIVVVLRLLSRNLMFS